MKLECRKIREDLYGKIGAAATEKIGDTGWVMGACPDFRLLSNLYQNENKIRNISFFHLKPLYHTEFLIVKYLTVLFFSTKLCSHIYYFIQLILTHTRLKRKLTLCCLPLFRRI